MAIPEGLRVALNEIRETAAAIADIYTLWGC